MDKDGLAKKGVTVFEIQILKNCWVLCGKKPEKKKKTLGKKKRMQGFGKRMQGKNKPLQGKNKRKEGLAKRKEGKNKTLQ